jgi:hypothetical protein
MPRRMTATWGAWRSFRNINKERNRKRRERRKRRGIQFGEPDQVGRLKARSAGADNGHSGLRVGSAPAALEPTYIRRPNPFRVSRPLRMA